MVVSHGPDCWHDSSSRLTHSCVGESSAMATAQIMSVVVLSFFVLGGGCEY